MLAQPAGQDVIGGESGAARYREEQQLAGSERSFGAGRSYPKLAAAFVSCHVGGLSAALARQNLPVI